MKAEFGLRFAKRSTTAYVVEVVGDLDLYTAPRLRSSIGELVGAGAGELIIDLTETAFVDSTALHVLLDARKRLGGVRGGLVVVCPNPSLRRVFEVTGVDGLLRLCPSVDDAVQLLSPEGVPAA